MQGWMGRCGPGGRLRAGRLADAAGAVDAIGIDMPIHLNETSDRVCDSAARHLIRPFTSRVFTAPVLCVLDCETYLDACAASFAALGKKISKQMNSYLASRERA